MVAFLGVMLTIQCTILIRLIELNMVIESFEMNLLLILFIVSFVLNLLSLFFFISTLTYLDKLQSSPKIDNLVDFDIGKMPVDYMIQNSIVSLKDCVSNNKKVLKEKSSKEKNALLLMRLGLVVTTIFNMLFNNYYIMLFKCLIKKIMAKLIGSLVGIQNLMLNM